MVLDPLCILMDGTTDDRLSVKRSDRVKSDTEELRNAFDHIPFEILKLSRQTSETADLEMAVEGAN